MMAWTFLILSGISEAIWAISMKYTNGLTRFWPTMFMLLMLAITIVFNAIAVKHLPVGTAYAVWTGIGTVGTLVLGSVMFNEPTDPARLTCIALIVSGVIGLKVMS